MVYTREASGARRLYVDGGLVVSGAMGGDFSAWDDGYALSLGNEPNGGRPWLGEFYLVAIFDRALSQTEVEQNCPNPFNPITEIRYDVPEGCWVRLEIYNILGQRVATVVDAYEDAGYKAVRWDSRSVEGGSLPSGVYLYRIQAGWFTAARRMVLLR